MKEILFGENAVIAVIGWFAFNVFMFSLHKDEDEQHFNIASYFKEHYDNWLLSLVFIPVLLIAGAKGFQIPSVDGVWIEWSDVYYLGSGFIIEFLKIQYKKWKQ